MDGYWLRGWTARSVGIGLVLGLFGAGCAGGGFRGQVPRKGRVPVKPDCSSMPTIPNPVAPKPIFCKHMIAVDPNKICPNFFLAPALPAVPLVPNVVWQGKRLVSGVSGDLAQYCQYQWVGAASRPDPNLLPLPKAEDCTFITPQTQSWPESFDDTARRQFLLSVTGLASPRRSMSGSGIRTRVVVHDTSPAANVQDLVSRHGETLANLIQDLACGDHPTDCVTQVKTQLVMPWHLIAGVPIYDDVHGGNVGQLGNVAGGMWAEIEIFRKELQDAADDLSMNLANTTKALNMPTRLVFNESFGFGDSPAGAQCDNNPANGPENVKALFDTFQAAACLGVAHVAAAGNHTGGESPSGGLLCPARWDKAVRPSLAVCQTLFGSTEFDLINDNFAKVTKAKYNTPTPHELFTPKTDSLVSVGCVDYAGTPCVMTRPGQSACPEAMALGIGGIAWNGASAGSAPPASMPSYFFGTSVSAAVVSARVAATWSQDDDHQRLNASGILQNVRSTNSRPLPFITGGACEHLASKLCKEIPWIGAPPASGNTSGSLQNPPFLDAITVDMQHAIPSQILHYQNDHDPICMGRIPQCVTKNASATAARDRYKAQSLVVWPQPPDPVCLRCWIIDLRNGRIELWVYPNGTLALPASPTESGTNLTVVKSAVLVIEDALGKVELTIPLVPSSLVSKPESEPGSFVVTKIEVPIATLQGKRAWISAYDDKGNSFSQQIFVFP